MAMALARVVRCPNYPAGYKPMAARHRSMRARQVLGKLGVPCE